jgi:hypothetical protein
MCLTKYHAKKTDWRSGGIDPVLKVKVKLYMRFTLTEQHVTKAYWGE